MSTEIQKGASETRLLGLVDDYAILRMPIAELTQPDLEQAADLWNALPAIDQVALKRYEKWRATQPQAGDLVPGGDEVISASIFREGRTPQRWYWPRPDSSQWDWIAAAVIGIIVLGLWLSNR